MEKILIVGNGNQGKINDPFLDKKESIVHHFSHSDNMKKITCNTTLTSPRESQGSRSDRLVSLEKTIDNFDIVLRLNNFETDNFEEFVGTKTDFYGISTNIPKEIIKKNIDKYEIKELYLYDVNLNSNHNKHSKSSGSISRNIFPGIEYINSKIKIKNISEYVNDYICDFYEFNKPPLTPYPSTGLAMIYYFCFFTCKQVYIYNFDILDLQIWDTSCYEHYDKSSPLSCEQLRTYGRENIHHKHSVYLEKKVLYDLIEFGFVKLL